jgi:hypothetical protein
MIRRISVAAISICIGACASSGPEAPAPAVTAASASVDVVASDNPSAPPAGVLHELDAPGVEQTASVALESASDEMVCRRERPTGSKMSRRVCRSRAEIEARELKDQDSLRRSRATQTGSNCALNGNC